MANEEHLKILKQGVEVWNKWRGENPGVRPDLREADLRGAHLVKAYLRGADLSDASLLGADLSEAILMEADLGEADLRGADLRGADLSGAVLRGANLRRVKLNNANLRGSDLRKANLSEADLSEADLKEADLREANLKQASLIGADLSVANLHSAELKQVILYRANLRRADLRETNLSGADLRDTDLIEANLNDANLCDSSLHRANLGGANLTGANLIMADLSGANLRGAYLTAAVLNSTGAVKANFESAVLAKTVFSNVDLSQTLGLDKCRYWVSNTVDPQTLEKSENLPVEFLRGCGLSDSLIEWYHTHHLEPIQFYSCFISYSSRNQDFADRLYADLQNKGVRCWLATEDLKIGDPFRDVIDQAIRLRDKLLLILSKPALQSEWVKDEVEAAFEEERKKNGKQILFPIRIDDGIMAAEKAWAAKLRRQRHIGDFTNWKDHDEYRKAFDRLMRDLAAG